MKNLFFRLLCLALTASILLLPASALTVEQARELLEEYYIDELPAQAQQAQTLEELFLAIGDPYTTYMTAEECDIFFSNLNDSELVGIGVSVQDHEKGVLIGDVLDHSPALEAGLEPGDIILSANGMPIANTDEASILLAGEEGTTVRIAVLRKDGSTAELDLIRRKIIVPTTAQFFLTDDENACVILCSSFGEGASSHFLEAIQTHEDQVNAWIVDLSANPGGTSDAASGSAGLFLGNGIMAYLRDGQGMYYYSFALPPEGDMTQKPVIALLSNYSASGSELFAAAIRDLGGGISIGQRTFGKGLAQVMLDQNSHPDLFEGDALKITAYRFFSPRGTTHDQGGILPTLLISPEHTYTAACLLCADAPDDPAGYLNITLSGYEFYIHIETAMLPENRPAFVELLEALPPRARIWVDKGNGGWARVTFDQVAELLDLPEYSPRTFSDLSGCGAVDAINTLAVYNLVSGYGDGTFRPGNAITRAEFCAMVVNALGISPTLSSGTVFSDVRPEQWYYDPIMAMYERGYISGYEDGSFQPDRVILQEEMVSIAANAAVWLSTSAFDMKHEQPTAEQLSRFSHYSDWAQPAALTLERCLVDLSALVPQQEATRAQAADLLFQLLSSTCALWPVVFDADT